MFKRIWMFLLVFSLASTCFGQAPKVVGSGKAVPTDAKLFMQQFGNLPLSFEINQGQVSPEVRFLSRGAGYELFLTATEAVMMVRTPGIQQNRIRPDRTRAQVSPVTTLRMRLVGSNASAAVEGAKPLQGKSNYFLGDDPKKWRTNVDQYAQVQYHNVYPGIDLVYYGNHGQLEHDFEAGTFSSLRFVCRRSYVL